jgi:phosphatidylinositol alpha-mannosyltransferase
VLVVAPTSRPASERGVRLVGTPVSVPYNGSTAPIDPRPWHVLDVRAVLRGFEPDLVHAHEPLAPNTSMWAVLASDVPVVATFHSGADRSWLFAIAAPALRLVARRIEARMAVSERAAAFVRSHAPGELVVVPNGIDAAAFARAEPADLGPGRKVLFVGRLHPRKGFRTAVAAFEALARERGDLRMVVAGSGDEAAAVETLPPEVRARVTMLGTVVNRQLPPIHRACDVFLGSSVGGESFGVVLLEAMAAGLPVVASRIPGYDEVVRDGVDGLLVPPGDPRALADAAGRLLDEPELAGALSAAGAERAALYDWEVVAGRIEEVYRSALGAGAAPVR